MLVKWDNIKDLDSSTRATLQRSFSWSSAECRSWTDLHQLLANLYSHKMCFNVFEWLHWGHGPFVNLLWARQDWRASLCKQLSMQNHWAYHWVRATKKMCNRQIILTFKVRRCSYSIQYNGYRVWCRIKFLGIILLNHLSKSPSSISPTCTLHINI